MEARKLEERIRAVLLYLENGKEIDEIADAMDVSTRTLRRWVKAYRVGGLQRLQPSKPGPKYSKHAIPKRLEQRILALKQKHLSWGARRIKYQYGLACHWTTVHRAIKRHGLLVRIKPKPQPSKRFQRRHVDSMWQGDTFHFRISGVGKVYVTGFTDDRSRYRIKSKAYLNRGAKEAINVLCHALKKGRIPREIYFDNGKQFVANDLKKEMAKFCIRPIDGKPYHPRERQDRELPQGTLQGADNTGQVYVIIAFQTRAQEV